jgi:hypothetical protein
MDNDIFLLTAELGEPEHRVQEFAGAGQCACGRW